MIESIKVVNGYKFTMVQAETLSGLGYNLIKDVFGYAEFAAKSNKGIFVHITCGGQYALECGGKKRYFWQFEKLLKKLEKVS